MESPPWPVRFAANAKLSPRLGFDFTFAFQPIVNVRTRTVFAYEALVRGTDGGGAPAVLRQLNDDNRYQFDQAARVKTIELAARLFPDDGSLLSINIMPNAIYDPVRCLRTTLKAAKANGFPQSRLMFEFTEHERVQDTEHLRRIAKHYSSFGFTTAIDDFGSGFAGLGFLAEFVPHIVKLDRELIRDVHLHPARQAIVRAMISAARDLDITLVAEGVETWDELSLILAFGIDLFQGYLFARPAVERLPDVPFEILDAPAGQPTVALAG